MSKNHPASRMDGGGDGWEKVWPCGWLVNRQSRPNFEGSPLVGKLFTSSSIFCSSALAIKSPPSPWKDSRALERKQQPSLGDEDCMNLKALICQSAQSGCAKTQSRVEVHDSSSAFGLWGDWWWRKICQCAHWRSVDTCNWIRNLGHIWMPTTATSAVDQGPAESKISNTAWWGHHVSKNIQVELLQLISLSLHWMRRRLWEQS